MGAFNKTPRRLEMNPAVAKMAYAIITMITAAIISSFICSVFLFKWLEKNIEWQLDLRNGYAMEKGK